MSLQHDGYKSSILPSLGEKRQQSESTFIPSQQGRQVENPNLLPSRQLPSLDSLTQQNDDYIRIKLSDMSVAGASPTHSPPLPRGLVNQRGNNDYFSPPFHHTEEVQQQVSSRRNSLIYDPIRNSTAIAADNTPLIKRIMQHDSVTQQRRHSIANFERSFSSHEINAHTTHNNHIYHPHHHHQHQMNQQHQNYYPYSAPSSPPFSHTLNSKNKHPSPYHHPHQRVKSDDSPPIQTTSRRNSSALLNYSRRRMSSSSSSTSSLQHRVSNHPQQQRHQANNEEQSEEKEDGLLYSRSPELRISHKLAERKRRKEMKDLFEELKEALPVDKSMKTSKWEILSKAVEYIGVLRHRDYNKEQELLMLKHELESLKNEKSRPIYHPHRLQ